ncbi:MOSC N-terminal beta barrel domain-containing protein [Nonomuraea sp. B12E4]|uniref:MOSC domain-containing protein n=1 Tax=Nonomuraea sp. B12E4 TaxID=3153564 RepID=UPI00325DE6D6
MALISELIFYPVKGCAGVSVSEAALTDAGLAHDRTFMVVDEDGFFRSQRTHPRLALVRPAITADGERLTLHAPGTDDLLLHVDADATRRDVRLFGKPYRGADQGQDTAEWLSELLGSPSRLVRVPPDHHRVTDGLTPGTSGYADSTAVSAISRASLDELNRRLDVPLPMSRFRPNIVIDGWERPHEEDRVRRVAAGNAELGYAKIAIRCVVTTVDQDKGVKTGPEPLRTLAAYRRAPGGGVAFGAKFSVLRPGKLTIGDELTVTSWGVPKL